MTLAVNDIRAIRRLVHEHEPYSAVLPYEGGYIITCPWLIRGLFKTDEGGGMTRIRIERWTNYDTQIGSLTDVPEALAQRKRYIASFGFYVWQEGRIMPTEDCWKIVPGLSG